MQILIWNIFEMTFCICNGLSNKAQKGHQRYLLRWHSPSNRVSLAFFVIDSVSKSNLCSCFQFYKPKIGLRHVMFKETCLCDNACRSRWSYEMLWFLIFVKFSLTSSTSRFVHLSIVSGSSFIGLLFNLWGSEHFIEITPECVLFLHP